MQQISEAYTTSHNDDITLLCSYTTRKEGFIDILLSLMILCSDEVLETLGKVSTHRGSSMGGEDDIFSANRYISLSTGFVSYKYSTPTIRAREDYIGGLGMFIPLGEVLKRERLRFSHCSKLGGIKDFALDENNIVQAVHIARKQGRLHDDGYGNVFEVCLWADLDTTKSQLFPRIISHPRVSLDETIIAAPISERDNILNAIGPRQEMYRELLSKLPKQPTTGVTIDGRDICDPERTRNLLEKMIKPFKEPNIYWYPHKNLDIAMKYLSLHHPLDNKSFAFEPSGPVPTDH